MPPAPSQGHRRSAADSGDGHFRKSGLTSLAARPWGWRGPHSCQPLTGPAAPRGWRAAWVTETWTPTQTQLQVHTHTHTDRAVTHGKRHCTRTHTHSPARWTRHRTWPQALRAALCSRPATCKTAGCPHGGSEPHRAATDRAGGGHAWATPQLSLLEAGRMSLGLLSLGVKPKGTGVCPAGNSLTRAGRYPSARLQLQSGLGKWPRVLPPRPTAKTPRS